MTAVVEAPAKVDIETRLKVEDFLYREAELLDAWALDDWLALWTSSCSYEVTPTGIDDGHGLSAQTVLFLIGDNRDRLEQRVIRMKKPTAHVEYPHSKTRHLYSNVRVTGIENGVIHVNANFATWRSKNRITTVYPGSLKYELVADGGDYLIRKKRVVLDLDALIPHGKVSIFL